MFCADRPGSQSRALAVGSLRQFPCCVEGMSLAPPEVPAHTWWGPVDDDACGGGFITSQPTWSQRVKVGQRKEPELGGAPVPALPPMGARSLSKTHAFSDPLVLPGWLQVCEAGSPGGQKFVEGLLFFQGCPNKVPKEDRELKRWKCIFSHFWRPEVQDQGVGRVRFF